MAMSTAGGDKGAAKKASSRTFGPKNTPPAPSKTKKIVVSQSVIDKIKSDGMTAALKKAGARGVSAAYMEGVKRMYGARRLAASVGKDVAKTTQKNVAKANEKGRTRSRFM